MGFAIQVPLPLAFLPSWITSWSLLLPSVFLPVPDNTWRTDSLQNESCTGSASTCVVWTRLRRKDA